MWDAGCRMKDAGCRMLDVGCGMLNVGCRIDLYPIQSYPILSCKKVKMSLKNGKHPTNVNSLFVA